MTPTYIPSDTTTDESVKEITMFALIASVILFLHGVGVLTNSENANWLVIGLAVWALHFAIGWGLPVAVQRER